jgi:hypothetical protein
MTEAMPLILLSSAVSAVQQGLEGGPKRTIVVLWLSKKGT